MHFVAVNPWGELQSGDSLLECLRCAETRAAGAAALPAAAEEEEGGGGEAEAGGAHGPQGEGA